MAIYFCIGIITVICMLSLGSLYMLVIWAKYWILSETMPKLQELKGIGSIVTSDDTYADYFRVLFGLSILLFLAIFLVGVIVKVPMLGVLLAILGTIIGAMHTARWYIKTKRSLDKCKEVRKEENVEP